MDLQFCEHGGRGRCIPRTVSVDADAGGSFVAHLALPADASTGSWGLLACRLQCRMSASARFRIAGDGELASRPTITARPRTIRFGHTQTIRGVRWPTGAACRRSVQVWLESAQNAVLLGRVRPSRHGGRFSLRWVPLANKVGAARWLIVGRQRCDSGRISAYASIRIR